VFREIEEELETSFEHANRRADELDAHVAMVGIIPTLKDLHVSIQNLSANPRYHLLNEQILEARGEDLQLSIEGQERLSLSINSIAMEAAATSVQIHLQVSPDGFGAAWNAAQAASAAQVAVGANSPFLLGKELWRETRIALFEQSIDTRSEELAAQGVRPRVWFGERWIDDVLDLFDENVRYFPALLPLIDDEQPEAVLERGDVPPCRSSCCTTARSGAGTGRSTRSRAASRTCGWRAACCRPARRWSTRSPTPPSTSGWCGR
jgi:hypothetical protein